MGNNLTSVTLIKIAHNKGASQSRRPEMAEVMCVRSYDVLSTKPLKTTFGINTNRILP